MELLEEYKLGELILKNRVVKSATFEGMCDDNGCPNENYIEKFKELAENGVGTLVTGFTYISSNGKAMHPKQGGLDREEKIDAYKKLTDAVHEHNSKIFLQIAHCGRQTRKKEIGVDAVGVSKKRSIYYLEKPKVLKTDEIYEIIEQFAEVSLLAKKAGFDGVQLHGAHGYLIHQFLLPSINNRKDLFKIDKETKLGTKFLDLVIDAIRNKCGKDFPIIIKISCNDNYFKTFTKMQYVNFIKFLDRKKVTAIEISCGTMDYSLNIFRGDIPVDVLLAKNPIYGTKNEVIKFLFKTIFLPIMRLKFKPFIEGYNLEYSKLAKENTDISIICVGGFRQAKFMNDVIKDKEADLISLSRPFVCEADFVNKVKKDNNYISKCTNCNICTVMCDSGQPLKCYSKGRG